MVPEQAEILNYQFSIINFNRAVPLLNLHRFPGLDDFGNPGDDREHQQLTDCGQDTYINDTRWWNEEAGDDEFLHLITHISIKIHNWHLAARIIYLSNKLVRISLSPHTSSDAII